MRTPIGVAMAILVACAAVYSFSPRSAPPLAATRIPVDRMQFNTLARSAAGLVAAGELGHIMFSADEGKNWQQATVTPQRYALINQIVFVNGLVGMAVGHEGWILRTEDGGRSWKELAFDKENGTPLMSIAQLPSGHWLAVGAFGRAMQSTDDGKTWTSLVIPGVEDKHLNRIVADPDKKVWLIAGERGLVLRSTDKGESWHIEPPFYDGSFYGAQALDTTHWIIYGMRGNVFHSEDGGVNWTKSRMPAPVSTFASARAADGRLLLVGQGGMLLASSDNGASFQVARRGSLATTLMDIAVLHDGSWLLAADTGLQHQAPIERSAGGAAAQTAALAASGAEK